MRQNENKRAPRPQGASGPTPARRRISWLQVATPPLLVAFLVAACLVSRQEQAEAKLGEFYGSLVNAEFADAQTSIQAASALSPNDGRYRAWAGYLAAQTIPAEEASCAIPPSSLTSPERQSAARAIAEYKEAVARNGFDAGFHHSMAWLYHRLGEQAQARSEYRRAIDLDSANPLLHASFGLFLEEAGELKAADEEYVRALSLSPQLLESRFFVDLRLRSSERSHALIEASIRRLESRMGQTGSPVIKAQLARFLMERGDGDRAYRLLTQAVEELPNLPLAWANLGVLQSKRGESEASLRSFRRASLLDGGHVTSALRLGNAYRQAGQRQLAFAEYHRAAMNSDARLPATAAHDFRLYKGSRRPIDNLLPTMLFRYLSSCDGAEAYRGLAELSAGRREEAYFRLRANDCQIVQPPHRICPEGPAGDSAVAGRSH